jgi:hypothetical protein
MINGIIHGIGVGIGIIAMLCLAELWRDRSWWR